MARSSLKMQGFSTKGMGGDLGAGLTKAIDSVTGGMANAVLAGVNPMYGLYTVLAATPVGVLFTTSVYMNIDSRRDCGDGRQHAAGLLRRRAPICPGDPDAAGGAVFMLAAGLLKLGFLTRFIANAVLRGFFTGIGVNIILSQLGDFTGYASEYSNEVREGGRYPAASEPDRPAGAVGRRGHGRADRRARPRALCQQALAAHCAGRGFGARATA